MAIRWVQPTPELEAERSRAGLTTQESSVLPRGVQHASTSAVIDRDNNRTCYDRRYSACLEAEYDRSAKQWRCVEAIDAVCGRDDACQNIDVDGCPGVPLNRLYVYDETAPGVPVRLHANPDGTPIWEPVDPYAGQPDSSFDEDPSDLGMLDAKTVALWFGIGAAAFLLLRRAR